MAWNSNVITNNNTLSSYEFLERHLRSDLGRGIVLTTKFNTGTYA